MLGTWRPARGPEEAPQRRGRIDLFPGERMPTEAPQSYENHVRRLPKLYVAIGLVLAANVLWTIALAYESPRMTTYAQIPVAIALLALLWPVRNFALTVQDRLIRLEERLRLAELLPADLEPRIGELSVGQLAALRFASDQELPALVRQVLDEKLTDRKEIKRRVKSWRADHLRV
jgi:hypothetical protein